MARVKLRKGSYYTLHAVDNGVPCRMIVKYMGRKVEEGNRFFEVMLVKYIDKRPRGWTEPKRTREELAAFGPGVLVHPRFVQGWELYNTKEGRALELGELWL